MEEKKDFTILIFALSFFYRGCMQFYDLSENAMVYIVCRKITCSAKTSLWRTWYTNTNNIPSSALVILYKMIQTRRSFLKIVLQYFYKDCYFQSSLKNIEHPWYHVRSSRLEVFYKKGALRNLAKFTGKHLCQSLFFNKVADKETLAQVFS